MRIYLIGILVLCGLTIVSGHHPESSIAAQEVKPRPKAADKERAVEDDIPDTRLETILNQLGFPYTTADADRVAEGLLIIAETQNAGNKAALAKIPFEPAKRNKFARNAWNNWLRGEILKQIQQAYGIDGVKKFQVKKEEAGE